jgi:hypothetical protein
MRATVLLLTVLCALTTACVTSAPANAHVTQAGHCDARPEVAGTWRSFRVSQAGPAWMTLTVHCDCTYETTVQLVWMRIRESGAVSSADGTLTFVRPNGNTTSWPYRLDGDKLHVEESPGEEHEYRRLRGGRC